MQFERARIFSCSLKAGSNENDQNYNINYSALTIQRQERESHIRNVIIGAVQPPAEGWRGREDVGELSKCQISERSSQLEACP